MLLGPESKYFPHHGIIGLAIGLMVIIRIIYGFIGSEYSRFNNFLYNPVAVVRYLWSILRGKAAKHIGHTPGSAYPIFAMLALSLGIVVSGVLIALGNKDVKYMHKFLVNLMLYVVIIHVLGVIVHIIQQRENIIASMIHGYKNVRKEFEISSHRPVLFLIFIFLVSAWTAFFFNKYNASKKTIKIKIPSYQTVRLYFGNNDKIREGNKQIQSVNKDKNDKLSK